MVFAKKMHFFESLARKNLFELGNRASKSFHTFSCHNKGMLERGAFNQFSIPTSNFSAFLLEPQELNIDLAVTGTEVMMQSICKNLNQQLISFSGRDKQMKIQDAEFTQMQNFKSRNSRCGIQHDSTLMHKNH